MNWPIKRIVTDVDPETEITPQSQSQSALAQPKNKEIETLLRVNDEKLDRFNWFNGSNAS